MPALRSSLSWILREISWHGVGGHRRSADIWRLGSSGKASEERWLPSWILKESLDVDLQRISITDTNSTPRGLQMSTLTRYLHRILTASQWDGWQWQVSPSVVSDSLQPHRLQPTRLLCPCNSPGKNTGGGAIPFSRGSSWPRDQVPWTVSRFFTVWALRDHQMT